MTVRRKPEGIFIRHRKACATQGGAGRCDCKPGYQAQVFSSLEQRTIRKTFRTLTDARAWRADTQAALSRGALRAPSKKTISEATEEWMAGARAGVIRTRSGHPYKPGALRGYDQSLRSRLLPRFGHLKISALHRNAVQDLVDEMMPRGLRRAR